MANDRQKTDKTPQKLPDGVLDEDFATEANNKGVALFNSGQFGLAEHFYHVAYACSPHDNVICENFISILCQQEKYQEAADLGAELYPQFKNNVRFCSFYANALNGTKQYQKALKICETFDGIEQSQDLRVFQFHYGLALYKAGSYRAAEARFFKSNALEEGKFDYDWLISCFEENGTFAANEKFMVEKLFTNEKTELSPGWRRLWLAKYYFCWSEKLALEGPNASKQKLTFAQHYIEQAADLASAAGAETEDAKDELKRINKLAAEIQAKVQGFEPPSGFKPDGPG